jgi:ribosome biogenesis protein MAK21
MKWLDKLKSHSQLIVPIEEGKAWYDVIQEINDTEKVINPSDLQNIREKVSKIFDKEVELYSKLRSNRKDADEKWIREVVKSGTLSDKIAALALIIQESPLHNIQSFDTLLKYCGQKEQRSVQMAMDAIKDLLIHNILPDRKLKPFSSHPFNHHDMTLNQVLLFWYEDLLIPRMKQFVDYIENIGLKSNIDYFKKYCMDITTELLIHKPEQEARLLSMLVNKMGDPSKVILSKCNELLDKVITTHPPMKSVIIREIRQFISRPNLNPKSIYVAVTYLTTIHLSKKDNDISLQLIDCYIGLFEKATKQNDFGSKLLSVLLHGINRVFPYLTDKKSLVPHVNILFKIAHNDHFSTAVQSLTLILHIILNPNPNVSSESHHSSHKNMPKDVHHKNNHENKDNDDNDDDDHSESSLINRFYRAVYTILFSDQIQSRSRNTLFFRLLYQSMKFDSSDIR